VKDKHRSLSDVHFSDSDVSDLLQRLCTSYTLYTISMINK